MGASESRQFIAVINIKVSRNHSLGKLIPVGCGRD